MNRILNAVLHAARMRTRHAVRRMDCLVPTPDVHGGCDRDQSIIMIVFRKTTRLID
ncbi:hypothetical protein [Xanthobacter tagetidis]|jgi:hypothetical protein|uniref:hypothetical protein n=1 Tax=Xanthobacter tagetidis TaxID=60216 RepID=UPI0014728BD5|nr:hypothetical protein [Xanthobacter tagetidis]MBB6309711.1 hypothetical protein [Xanthobacter tagetidis]